MENQVSAVDGIIEDIKEFLPRLIQACESVSELFYEPMNDDSWQVFGELVQGMDDLYKTLNTVASELASRGFDDVQFPIIEKFKSGLSEKFGILNQLVDDEEFIAAGDTIKYELLVHFQQLRDQLGEETAKMLERFAVNMNYLKKDFPRVYKIMKLCEKDTMHYQVTYAKNAEPNLMVLKEDQKQIYLYSKYDPGYEVGRWVETLSQTVSQKSNVIVYGFGFGYHMLKFAEHYPERQLYLYEPDEQVFLAAMHVIDLKEIFTRINVKDLIVGKDKDQRDSMFYRFLKMAKGETATISIPVYDKLDQQPKIDFIADAKLAILNYASSRRMYDKFGLQWTKNMLLNTGVNINTPTIAGLKGRFEGVSAVIVGAGPSLEADIEYLRDLKTHALIIAAGSSIQSLLHFGIEPHLIVSMDGADSNFRVFSNVDTKSIPFLYAPQIEYRIIENKYTNLFHIYFTNDIITQYVMGLTNDDPVFASNHSVTGTAIQAALFMGCKEIIFTGQDLSYPSGSIYAPGAKHVSKNYSDQIIAAASEHSVKNVNGTMNRTTNGMKMTLADIEDLLSKYPDIRFVNTSRMGAKIKYTVQQPMEELVGQLKNVEISGQFMIEMVERHLKPYDDKRKAETVKRVAVYPKQLSEMELKLKRIKKSLEKLQELSRSNPQKCINKMVEIEEEWGDIVGTISFNTLFLTIVKNEIYEFDRELPEMAGEKNVIKKAKMFYDILGGLVSDMQKKLPELLELTEMALQNIEKRNQPLKAKSQSEVLL